MSACVPDRLMFELQRASTLTKGSPIRAKPLMTSITLIRSVFIVGCIVEFMLNHTLLIRNCIFDITMIALFQVRNIICSVF